MPLQFNHISWLSLQILTLMLAALPLLINWPLPVDVITLSQAQLGSTGTSVELPDDWRSRSYSGQQEVYQFSLMLEQAPLETWALLLPSVNLRAQVKLNNHPLTHNENDYNSSTARMWFQPLLYPLSSGLLQQGSNQLQITISNAATHGYLATPLVGTYSALASYTARSQLFRQTLLQIIVIAMSVVALLMLFLWLQRRQDVIYGLYGLGMLCWAAHDLNFIVTNPVLPAQYWDAFSVLTLGGFITATTFFIHRYLVGLKRSRIEHAILWFSLLGAPLLFLLPPPALQIFSNYIWHPVIMSFGLYLYLLMYTHAWRQSGFELQLMAMTGSVMVLYGGHDTLIKLGFLPWDLGYMLPYSAATSLLVFSSLLVNRFAKNLDAMEGISRDLDQRIKAAAEVIENNRIKLRDHDRERLLSAERERVARDIHDGVGGQLIALLSLIRGGRYSVKETENSLIQAMHDL
ncbi:MAG: hypothetical protein H8E21_16140, partial [Gammaproteobacteria bacterium]|nr:hypothetical protein [Gammaproteobacteria bacterium]